jgi:putative Holliday junction resolvase
VRILALDVGERRIGLAICDEEEIIATPLDTLPRGQGLAAVLAAVVARARAEEAGEIVVGMPIPLSGGTNAQRAAVEAFVEELRKVSPVPVTTADERMTSKIAERSLIEGGVRRRGRRQVIDRVAAALILEGHLARRRRSRLDES